VERPRESSVSVVVVEHGNDTAWTEVADLSVAGPKDAVFAVSADTGVIRFGDGEHGRRPAKGATVRVSYFHGARLSRQDLTVEQTYLHGHHGREPAGKIAQIMPPGGWSTVVRGPGGEQLVPLVAWALLDPYVPVYRSGNEPPVASVQSVRGLVVSPAGMVEVVDEAASTFAGYRL
jgi:hypothetical protein